MTPSPAQLGFFEEVTGEVRVASKSRRARQARKRGARAPGPKPRENRKGFVKHAARPVHNWRHPVHVTMRRVRLGPSFRLQAVYGAVLAELAASRHRGV